MKLKESLELGGRHLLGWLDPERNWLPTGSWAITHDLGRWWDAMLRLEDATGFEIPGHMEGANLANLHWLTDNPDGLLWVPPGLDWHPVKFEFHSLREGILTFAALARFRGSAWARRAGRRYLESIDNGLAPDFSWDVGKFEYARQYQGAENQHPGHTPENENRFQKTVSHGAASRPWSGTTAGRETTSPSTSPNAWRASIWTTRSPPTAAFLVT